MPLPEIAGIGGDLARWNCGVRKEGELVTLRFAGSVGVSDWNK